MDKNKEYKEIINQMVEEVIEPTGIDEEIIMSQTGCSLERASMVLRMFNNNIVDSIMFLIDLFLNL